MARIETTAAPARGWRQLALLVAGDTLAFLVFATLGRRSHGQEAGLEALLATLGTAAPFVLGWLLVAPFVGAYRSTLWGRPAPMARRTALAWLGAWPLGLVLRALIVQRPIPLSFALVVGITNTLLLLGWRVVLALLTRRPH
jgi:hypothetical protein